MCLYVTGALQHPSLIFSVPGRLHIERRLIKWIPTGVALLQACHLGWPTKNKIETNKIKKRALSGSQRQEKKKKKSLHSFVIAVLQASMLVRSSKVALG